MRTEGGVRNRALPQCSQSSSSTPQPLLLSPQHYLVRIADISVSITSVDPELPLRIEGATKKFVVDEANPDVRVRAAWGHLANGRGGEKLFDSGGLWELYVENGLYRFDFICPTLGAHPYRVGFFSRDFTSGEVYLHRPYFHPIRPVYPVPQNAAHLSAGMNPVRSQPKPRPQSYGANVLNFPEGRHPKATDVSQWYGVYPLEYPLDELLMINLLATGRGVEVHACGVIDPLGNGYLFVGQSGAGKTTMARLWEPVLSKAEGPVLSPSTPLRINSAEGREDGVRILSDDRIILRKVGNRLWMYGTPWHGEAELAYPDQAPLKQIFLLRHGQKNELVPISGAEASSRLFACSFPPFYSAGALEFTLVFFEELVSAVPCYELRFVPNQNVVDFLAGLAE